MAEITAYMAECHKNSLGAERWLILLPVRLVRRGDVVSDDPWSAQRKVRWVRWFRSSYLRNACVYLDVPNTRGYVVREEY